MPLSGTIVMLDMGSDNAQVLWTKTFEVPHKAGQNWQRSVRLLGFALRGQAVIVHATDGEVLVWDVASGDVLWKYTSAFPQPVVCGVMHENFILSYSLSAPAVEIFDVATGEKLWRNRFHIVCPAVFLNRPPLFFDG